MKTLDQFLSENLNKTALDLHIDKMRDHVADFRRNKHPAIQKRCDTASAHLDKMSKANDTSDGIGHHIDHLKKIYAHLQDGNNKL